VNVVWVGFDLVVMSVLYKAVRYRGFVPEERIADAV
jgi:cellulose synthase (UDP-forming)